MIAITVTEQSQVAEARRQAAQLAENNALDAEGVGRISLVVTELATNLIKHANGGEILVSTFADDDGSGVQVLALDRGPGMKDVQACVEDGYSSAGTRGNGLGAVIRQSNFVDIASWLGVGTGVLARIEALPPERPDRPIPKCCWGAVSVSKPGEEVCGDSWSVSTAGSDCTLFVADGLGHGQEAAEASVEAVRLFHRFNGHQVSTVLDYVHGGLRATRGAAVSVARFEPATGSVAFSGIGNVAGVLIANGSVKHMVSMAGTAGFNARKARSFDYPFRGGLIILYSDGLSSTWTLDKYPNLGASHPTLIAGILYRDFSRHRDDATVLVGKWKVQ